MEKPFAYLEDSFEPREFDYMDMVAYVALRKATPLDIKDFYYIEEGFRDKWNTHTGNLIGDGDFKNHVYLYIERAMETGLIKDVIPQPTVDECVDLILDYMASIGEWYSDFSRS
ncbi:MAG: hypothetical protein CVU03_02055 [Bacteroidetes bacterium HGW-Bacteroidetes-2]|nr:MAG: hypothetical protein CVU13_06260 [Bacteroidetes bacterium HGW-Bacteroidetes-8]PKP26680.1 MAG: hypothetical protein CVU03_02055 [Bacteroidetes bacterium HGW-Bacteroidetes-2]